MSSTFKELFDDFTDRVKIYTEKLDITPLSFMRMYTRGVQDFQKKTTLFQVVVDITKNNDGDFMEPSDAMYIIGIRDENGYPIEHRDLEQLFRAMDQSESGYFHDPIFYDARLRDSGYMEDGVNLVSIKNRKFVFHTAYSGTVIKLHYIPDLPAFTSNSKLWYPSQFGGDAADDWFPIEANFEAKFNSWSVHPYLTPYEHAFLNYAIAEWVMSQGNQNYVAFRQAYDQEVAWAMQNKRQMFRGGMPSYVLGPGMY